MEATQVVIGWMPRNYVDVRELKHKAASNNNNAMNNDNIRKDKAMTKVVTYMVLLYSVPAGRKDGLLVLSVLSVGMASGVDLGVEVVEEDGMIKIAISSALSTLALPFTTFR